MGYFLSCKVCLNGRGIVVWGTRESYVCVYYHDARGYILACLFLDVKLQYRTSVPPWFMSWGGGA